MMNDLISRQAAIDALNNIKIPRNASWYQYYCQALTAMNRLPSEQPKRGKWVKISPANIYECSKCGKHVMTNDISAYDFCHGCGADMRGADNGTDL